MVQRYAITRPDLVGPPSGTSATWRMLPQRRVYRTAASAIEDRPADVVPQPFVVEHELTDRLGELAALPSTLEPPCALDLSFRRGCTCGLDRIRGGAELVSGDVCDGCG